MPKGTPRKPPKFHKTYPVRGTPRDPEPGVRYCAWCGNPFPRQQYGARKWCSPVCRYTGTRDDFLFANYGVRIEDYLRMKENQDGRCAVCQRKGKITLAVEHSHITGTVRGLCCMGCNRDVIGPIDGDLDKINNTIAFFQRMRDDLAAHLTSNDGDTFNPALPDPRLEANSTE